MNQEPNPASPAREDDAAPTAPDDGAANRLPPVEAVRWLVDDDEIDEQPALRANGAGAANPAGDEAVVLLPASLDDDDADQSDLTADIFPAIPSGHKRGLNLPGGGRRISIGELESHHVHQGTHPGDKFVRRSRPTEEGFRRVGPGHLEALPRTLEPTTGFGRIFGVLKRFLIGSPLSTAAAAHERLTKVKALAVLSSDALSSVTYATEAILGVLFLAGSQAFSYNVPIAIAIAVLIAIVVFSYRQTIFAYPKTVSISRIH